MSLYLGSEKVKNVTAQITLPVEPSDDLPLADGTASAGTSKKFSRADHVHPMETVEATLVDLPSAEELGAIPAPTSGTTGQVLTKTADGQKWADVPVDENNVLLADANIVLPLSDQCNSVTYGDGKFVIVCASGSAIAYSTDATHWVEVTLPSTANRRSVIYGDGKFVAVDYHGNVAYSVDAINWIEVNPSAGGNWESIAYGGGKFVAIAVFDQVIYSTDGINWTSGGINNYPQAVTYGNGKFVAVSGNELKAVYSSDGVTWTFSEASSKGSWQSITYGDGKFVAVGNSSAAIYSTDGISWTTTTLPLKASWRSITYGNGKFVAVSNNSNAVIYSTDGINWTKIIVESNAGWGAVTYGDGKFVAVGFDESNPAVAYSTDGINWNSTTKGLQYPDGTDIHEQVKSALQIKIPEPESEVFVCTITYSNSAFTCDKTFNEIKSAFDAGKVCIAKYIENSQQAYICYLTYKTEGRGKINLYFTNILNKTDSDFKRYKIIISNTNSVTLTSEDISTIPTARKVTLTTSGWSNNQQSVTCSGVSSSATSQEIRVMPADASKTSTYVSCGVSCVAQTANKLTFACDKAPTTAIDVYVVMQSLNFQS